MTDVIPRNLRFTKDHEWARLEGDGTLVVGITAHAVDSLGDITVVTLPDVGEQVTADQRFGDIDSVKAVSDLYAPISGEVVEVNAALDNEPEVINAEPYTDGWMIRVRPAEGVDLGELLDAEAYRQLLD